MSDLSRGDVVYYGERGEYSGKLRPGVIIQHQSTLAEAPSITICGITSTPIPTNAARVPVSPSDGNGLKLPSFVMVDKVASINRSRIRQVFGHLSLDELHLVDQALRRWLDL